MKEENITGYEEALGYIRGAVEKSKEKFERRDAEFKRVIQDVRSWAPALRRNSEGEYKIELRAHLKSLGYSLNEEFGESKVDLLVNKKHAIETKKEPQLGSARHLQHQRNVIALIFDVPSEDKFSNFVSLVDRYLNKGDNSVEIMKK